MVYARVIRGALLGDEAPLKCSQVVGGQQESPGGESGPGDSCRRIIRAACPGPQNDLEASTLRPFERTSKVPSGESSTVSVFPRRSTTIT